MYKSRNILKKIKCYVCKNGYSMTKHAAERSLERHLSPADIKDILVNARRIVRIDINEKTGDKIYKIKGGRKNRGLAVCIYDDEESVIIITVM